MKFFFLLFFLTITVSQFSLASEKMYSIESLNVTRQVVADMVSRDEQKIILGSLAALMYRLGEPVDESRRLEGYVCVVSDLPVKTIGAYFISSKADWDDLDVIDYVKSDYVCIQEVGFSG